MNLGTWQQVKLDATELAFLLHLQGAKRVLGLDEGYFFPEDQALLDERMAEGFQLLKKHGWLIPDADDEGLNTNTSIMLLTAVLAAPEKQLVVQRMVEHDQFQLLTYSWAQDYLVEQYRTVDNHYILTNLQNEEAVIDRLASAFEISESAETYKIQVPVSAFQEIVTTSDQQQRITEWQAILSSDQQGLAFQLATLIRVGILALQKVNAQVPAEIILFRDGQGVCWSLQEKNQMIILTTLTRHELAQILASDGS